MSRKIPSSRFLKLFNRWLEQCPAAFRDHIRQMDGLRDAERKRAAMAEDRAEAAERRERDSGRGVSRLKQRIAELESRA